MNLEAATTKAGEQIVTRKYNQRTNDWDVKIITVKKKFEYIPVMMVKIFNMRKEDTDIVTRQVSLNESNPALLALTIAEKRHSLQRNFLWHIKADFNLVLKIIQRIPQVVIKIQRGQTENCCCSKYLKLSWNFSSVGYCPKG